MIKIEIHDGRKKVFKVAKDLHKEHFVFKSTSKYCGYWTKDIKNEELVFWKQYCLRNGFLIKSYEPALFERGNDYRINFFRNNPAIYKDYYRCVYCGRLIRKENIEIDHMIPIKKGKESRLWQFLIKKSNLISINDIRNLVPACRRCNKRKGSKTGHWILIGLLGRLKFFWPAIHLFMIFFICIILKNIINYDIISL